MDIRDLLLAVAATYDKNAKTTKGVPGQDLLRDAPKHLSGKVPAGFQVRGYGGKGGASSTPWIGVFDPDETVDPKEGLYLAYIYAADLESVTLTLQQGVTRLQEALKTGEVLRTHLEQMARQFYDSLPKQLMLDWQHRPSFAHGGWRALAYEASSVAARRYTIGNMPSEKSLRDDLWHMAEVLQRAGSLKNHIWRQNAPEGLEIEYEQDSQTEKDPLEGFRPKDSSDYVSEIAARQQVKQRRHESLIAEFGPYIADRGFAPITEGVHPRDLVLRSGAAEWLVEVKVVKTGNPTKAVREALAQLLEYRHFLYFEKVTPYLVALFTEDVGVYTDYLEMQGIASVWKAANGWAGSPSAVAWSLVD